MTTYDFPMNERIRNMMRLQQLFRQLELHVNLSNQSDFYAFCVAGSMYSTWVLVGYFGVLWVVCPGNFFWGQSKWGISDAWVTTIDLWYYIGHENLLRSCHCPNLRRIGWIFLEIGFAAHVGGPDPRGRHVQRRH